MCTYRRLPGCVFSNVVAFSASVHSSIHPPIHLFTHSIYLVRFWGLSGRGSSDAFHWVSCLLFPSPDFSLSWDYIPYSADLFPPWDLWLSSSISKPSPVHFESSNIARPHSEQHSGRMVINFVLWTLNQYPRDSAGCHMHALVLWLLLSFHKVSLGCLKGTVLFPHQRQSASVSLDRTFLRHSNQHSFLRQLSNWLLKEFWKQHA